MPEPVPSLSGWLEVEDRRIFWEYFGDRRQPPVCLLNGLAMHTKAWYPFLDRLRPDYDVLLFDYPGQGESTCRDEPCTLPGLATYLRLIADSLHLERLHLVGVSYGGFVAEEFARLYQQRLLTLTLSGILLSHEALFDLYQALSLRFYRGGSAAFELYTHYMYEKIFGEDFVRRMGAARLETMRQRFYERYSERVFCLIRLTEAQDPFFAALDELLPHYRAIRVPTLVMPGADDRAIPPAAQRKICDIIPGAQWSPIPHSGHVVYLEQPEEFWSRLRDFMTAATGAARLQS
ncbi:MAG: alpha/beta fold hydrolase [Vicinamibacterales bacterium]